MLKIVKPLLRLHQLVPQNAKFVAFSVLSDKDVQFKLKESLKASKMAQNTGQPTSNTEHASSQQSLKSVLKPLEQPLEKKTSNKLKIGPQVLTNFRELGLDKTLVDALNSQGICVPTSVQATVIPRALKGENVLMAASTGSGKTYAYLLPCIQQMVKQEKDGYVRAPKRPRCLVLVPTRDLAKQVLRQVKLIGHHYKIASCATFGGEDYGIQKRQLNRLVDVVVASPGRLVQHWKQNNVFLSQVTHVVIDEVDTMLTQGFGKDIRTILRTTVGKGYDLQGQPLSVADVGASSVRAVPKGFESDEDDDDDKEGEELSEDGVGREGAPDVNFQDREHELDDLPKDFQLRTQSARLIMATATLTKSVKHLIMDMKAGEFNIEQNSGGKQHSDDEDEESAIPKKPIKVDVKIVEVDGTHRILPNVKHNLEYLKPSDDKLKVLLGVLGRAHHRGMRTLIFCNTVASCRAAEFAINESAGTNINTTTALKMSGEFDPNSPIRTLRYHGDLDSNERSENLEKFRNGEQQYLVCTDIAARGLDIPETAHVVMFDFPLNPTDYLHRAGRCGRMGRTGEVTALVGKRDIVLARAIQKATEKGLPIDSLSSDKQDYKGAGRLVATFRPVKTRAQMDEREQRNRKFLRISRNKQVLEKQKRHDEEVQARITSRKGANLTGVELSPEVIRRAFGGKSKSRKTKGKKGH